MKYSPIIWASAYLISRLIRSYRYVVSNDAIVQNCKRPPVFALFHSTQMLVASYRTNFKTNILVSLSKDGEIAAQALQMLGFGVVRGSSSKRGREALDELILKVRSGESAAITVDGPRGPCEEVKSGIIRLASESNAPIVCVSAAAKVMYRLKNSWDRFIVAPPLSKVFISFSDPITVDRIVDAEEIKFFKSLIKTKLRSLFEDSLKMVQKI
ncbi:MAG: lysophospholipid acyltransferase family protein [Myxococcota bacterium]